MPSPRILRMTFDTDADRLREVEVRMLRASSGMGNPGMAVPNGAPSGPSCTGVELPLRDGDPSKSAPNEGVSNTTGVREIRGGAGFEETSLSEVGRCSEADLDEGFGCAFGSAEEDGCLCRVPLETCWPTRVGEVDDEVKGTAKLFFMREKREETNA